jgi:hypothetical protein
MSTKEAQARIKINQLLEQAGWRFLTTNTAKPISALKPTANLPNSKTKMALLTIYYSMNAASR